MGRTWGRKKAGEEIAGVLCLGFDVRWLVAERSWRAPAPALSQLDGMMLAGMVLPASCTPSVEHLISRNRLR